MFNSIRWVLWINCPDTLRSSRSGLVEELHNDQSGMSHNCNYLEVMHLFTLRNESVLWSSWNKGKACLHHTAFRGYTQGVSPSKFLPTKRGWQICTKATWDFLFAYWPHQTVRRLRGDHLLGIKCELTQPVITVTYTNLVCALFAVQTNSHQ